jgi:hypothetical protein
VSWLGVHGDDALARPIYEESLALARASGDAALRRLRAEGARSSLDDAVALALSDPELPTPGSA